MGKQLADLRISRGVSRLVLSPSSKLASSTIKSIENGERNFRLPTLYKYCTGLGIDISTLQW